jgi:hypothetical protein
VDSIMKKLCRVKVGYNNIMSALIPHPFLIGQAFSNVDTQLFMRFLDTSAVSIPRSHTSAYGYGMMIQTSQTANYPHWMSCS